MGHVYTSFGVSLTLFMVWLVEIYAAEHHRPVVWLYAAGVMSVITIVRLIAHKRNRDNWWTHPDDFPEG